VIYTRKEGETELELLWRVASDKEKNNWTWDDVAREMNELTGKCKGESSWRKKFRGMQNVFYGKKDKKVVVESKDEPTTLSDQLRELEIAKIQYRDERNAWQKQNYTQARVEQKLDYLEEELKTLGKINFKQHSKPVINGDNEMIIMLSDWHIGQCFDSLIGSYNSDIAKQRIAELLINVIEYADMYKIKKAHVVLLGDLISGNIHTTIQVTNRENVIDQVKLATELISSFCYECTNYFENVQFYSVVGNHSRISRKDDSIHEDRLDDLIAWAVDLSLSHIENFHYFKHRNLDNGIVDMNVCGNSYVAVHGDFDPANKSGASNLSMMLGFIPLAVLRGHLHSPSWNEYNGVKVIQGGSLAGAGDQYTLEKRLFGKPSQTLLICDDKGIKAHLPIELN